MGYRNHGAWQLLAIDVEDAVAQRRESGEAGVAHATAVARGTGWSVGDVVCNLGPHDQPFEETHRGVSIALVLAGTFQYRTAHGRELMMPGSLMLGNHAQPFECSHDHASGDRCLAFRFDDEYFERIAFDVGGSRTGFRIGRLPPMRELAHASAVASAGVLRVAPVAWDELAVQMLAQTLRIANDSSRIVATPRGAEARITASVRAIERDPALPHTLQELAEHAALSPFHYLRTFQQTTGLTPHQFIIRTRLRAAAAQLRTSNARIIDIALACGFGDVSNFNHAFRSEFGMSPRRFRSVPQQRIFE